jgi:hypothetical protein
MLNAIWGGIRSMAVNRSSEYGLSFALREGGAVSGSYV